MNTFAKIYVTTNGIQKIMKIQVTDSLIHLLESKFRNREYLLKV